MIYYQQNFICMASVYISISQSANFLDTYTNTYTHIHEEMKNTNEQFIFTQNEDSKQNSLISTIVCKIERERDRKRG